MKYILSFALLLVSLLPYTESGECTSCRQQDKAYVCAGNTLSMNFRLCMDMTEVSGLMYKAFLEDMKIKHGEKSPEFVNNLPDFRIWEELFPGKTMAQISRLFLEDEVFALMPIVAVSYEQAVNFCEWRTQRFKDELAAMDPKKRAAFPKDFKFRLPTPKEWARMRFMYQDKGMQKRIEKTAKNNMKVFKFKKNEVLNNNLKIEHIYSVMEPKSGMFNVFNSVAEMTDEKGVAMGGSWILGNDAKKYDRTYNYAVPTAWLGFRCIFEIIE